MNIYRLVLHSMLFLSPVLGICTVFTFSGCQQPVQKQETIEPVFFPKPPDQARLQFLKSFSRPDDIGAKGPSAFERFIVGEPQKTDLIRKPYGIALFENKLYVCDVSLKKVVVLDLKNQTFHYLTNDERLSNPVNIFIDTDGSKYVTDSDAGAIFVFDRTDNLLTILGRNLGIKPVDVVVRGKYCCITDLNNNQVVIMNKTTGKVVARIGSQGEGPGQFKLISDIVLDRFGNIYVTDKFNARITKFNNYGRFVKTFGQLGDRIDEFVRPKGIDIDRQGRIWVVDAAAEVVKVLNPQGRLLLFFGLPGNRPGMMNLPAKVRIDYNHVRTFQRYAVPGAKLEFLVLVTNQYGLNKINVYGFGSFPQTSVPHDAELVKQPDKTAQNPE